MYLSENWRGGTRVHDTGSRREHLYGPRQTLESLFLWVVLPDNSYYLTFLIFFRSSVEVRSSVIVASEEDPEP